jgi:hypothetical protein
LVPYKAEQKPKPSQRDGYETLISSKLRTKIFKKNKIKRYLYKAQNTNLQKFWLKKE